MKNYYYRENARRGLREFEIKDDVIAITGKAGFSKFNFEIKLRDISPKSERGTFHNHGALKRASIYLMIVFFGAALMRYQNLIPFSVVLIAACLLSIPAIVTIARLFRPPVAEIFRNHDGIVVFDIMLAESQADDFESYIKLLRTAVVNAQQEK